MSEIPYSFLLPPPPPPLPSSYTTTTATSTSPAVVPAEESVTYFWTICNFLTRDLINRPASSPHFSGQFDDNFKWCLICYEDNGFFFVRVRLVTRKRSLSVRKKVKIAILTPEFQHYNVRQTCDSGCTFDRDFEVDFPRFISRSALSRSALEMLSCGNLTVYCQISNPGNQNASAICGGDTITSSSSNNNNNNFHFQIPKSRLEDDFNELFESQALSDVVLIVNGREFRCHMSVLAARSPVFQAMFTHDTIDKRTRRVEIKDVANHAVFLELLKFLYTGRTPAPENLTWELLVVADRYAIERLKVLCSEAIYSRVEPETAACDLIWADLYVADQLKKLLMDFIVLNTKHVVASGSWKNLERQRPDLVSEILLAKSTASLSSPCSACPPMTMTTTPSTSSSSSSSPKRLRAV